MESGVRSRAWISGGENRGIFAVKLERISQDAGNCVFDENRNGDFREMQALHPCR